MSALHPWQLGGSADGKPPRQNGSPQPIGYPQHAQQQRPAAPEICRTRANADNARWQAQVEQRDTLIQAAATMGRQEGERQGYTAGWHWGCACGAVAGGLAVGLLWIGWAPLQALIATALAGWLA